VAARGRSGYGTERAGARGWPPDHGGTEGAPSIGIDIYRFHLHDRWYDRGEFELDPGARDDPLLAQLALSLQVEILRGGEVVDTTGLLTSAGGYSYHVSSSGLHGLLFWSVRLYDFPEDVLADEEKQADWTIRATGTPREVLHVMSATHYWAGTVEVLLAEALRRGKEWTVRR